MPMRRICQPTHGGFLWSEGKVSGGRKSGTCRALFDVHILLKECVSLEHLRNLLIFLDVVVRARFQEDWR